LLRMHERMVRITVDARIAAPPLARVCAAMQARAASHATTRRNAECARRLVQGDALQHATHSVAAGTGHACNAEPSVGNLQHARQHAAWCHRRPTACNILHAACSGHRLACNNDHASTYHLEHAAYSMRTGAGSMQLAATRTAHAASLPRAAMRVGDRDGAPAGSTACAGCQSTLDGASMMPNGVSFGSASAQATSRPRAEASPNSVALRWQQPAPAATAASARCAENVPWEASRRIRALGIVLRINRAAIPHTA
jgi:hypothetical protein